MKYDSNSYDHHLNIKDVRFISRRLFIKLEYLIFIDPVSKNKVNTTNRYHYRYTPTVDQNN